MRYARNSIQLSHSRDVPLLRQVMRSEFVTHSQLFEFMQLSHQERSRKSFDWRLRRLVSRDLVKRQVDPTCKADFVYSITSKAALLLQGAGEYSIVGRTRFNGREVERSIFHAVALNEFQLSLLRTGTLVRWIGSLEIRSQNELTGFGFAKDYDAVVTIQSAGKEYRFALEYERTPKSFRRYREIAEALNHEIQVTRVLYLVSNYDLLQFVSRFFNTVRCRVLFGLESDWREHLLDMRVRCNSGATPLSLSQALGDVPASTAATPIGSTFPLNF